MGHHHAHGAHGHDHGHAHAHAHVGAGIDIGSAFAIGIGLNLLFVLVETAFGIVAHSTALLADAAHNASDVLGLILAWGAQKLAQRKPSARRTYGLRRSTVLAALANAVLLLVGVGAVCAEAVRGLYGGAAAHGETMIAVAAAGVLVNGVSAMLFFKGRKGDLNVRGAFLHLATDAAVSLGVVLAGLGLLYTGWQQIDPLVSLCVSAIVLWGTWRLLRDSLHLALDGVPEHVDVDQVRAYLEALPDVREVHDLHVWAMSTTEVALTAHVTMPWSTCPPEFFTRLEDELYQRFGIHHATVQIEPSEVPAGCRLAARDSV